MKRVLVTGAGGQLGRSIQDLAAEYPVLNCLFLDKKGMDITSPHQVLEVFHDFRPDFCINCAAYTRVDQAEQTPEPAFAVNVEGVANLVKACNEFNTILIHISTDYVFDGKKEEGYYPEDAPNPINVYGKTKLEGERIMQQEMDRYFIIRTSWLYSRKYGPNFYLTILEKGKRGENLIVTDAQRGCPTDAANLARYILDLITSGSRDFGISHFTDGAVMSWYEFAVKIIEEASLSNSVRVFRGEAYPSPAKRPASSCLFQFKPGHY